MRIRYILLVLAALLVIGELVYLVYANLQIDSVVHAVADAADVEVQYQRAYTRYPGDLQLRGLRIASREKERWSVYLGRVELVTNPSSLAHGVLIVPTQVAVLQVGTHVLEVLARGDLRLLGAPDGVPALQSDGGHLHLRSYERGGRPGDALNAELTLDEASLSGPRGLTMHGEIAARGDNARMLLGALDTDTDVPSLKSEPWQLYGKLAVTTHAVDISAIYLTTPSLSLRGAYRHDGAERARFLLVPKGKRETGLELRDGKLVPTQPEGINGTSLMPRAS